MKLSIKRPTGIEIEFEGDESDFGRLTSFLEQLPAYVEDLGHAPEPEPEGDDDEAGGPGSDHGPLSLDAAHIHERIKKVQASDHIKRLTVMAQAAVDAGMEGIDFPTADRLYAEIGIPKPGNWKSAFGNARTKGFLRSVSRGRWRPTTRGENFAKYGTDQSRPKRSRDNGSTEGGESD